MVAGAAWGALARGDLELGALSRDSRRRSDCPLPSPRGLGFSRHRAGPGFRLGRPLGLGGNRRDCGGRVGLGFGSASASRAGPGRAAHRASQPVGARSGGSPAAGGARRLARDGRSWLAGGSGRGALRRRGPGLDAGRHRFDVRVGGAGRAGGGGRGVDPLAAQGAPAAGPARCVAGSRSRPGARGSLGGLPARRAGSGRPSGRGAAARGSVAPGPKHLRRGGCFRLRGASASRLGSGVHELDSGEPLAAGAGPASAGRSGHGCPQPAGPGAVRTRDRRFGPAAVAGGALRPGSAGRAE